MTLLKSKYFASGIIFGVLLLQGCSSYEPVSVSKCDAVIKHAKKVLGEMAPTHSKMQAECKAATDQERGCMMAATTKGQISQCL